MALIFIATATKHINSTFEIEMGYDDKLQKYFISHQKDISFA